MKLEEKRRAIQLRHRGKSLKEIAAQIGVSKSSVSLWVHDLPLSPEARARIVNRQTAGQRASQQTYFKRTAAKLSTARVEAQQMLRSVTITSELALLSCALLYWCEGAKDKNDKTFTFSNSDPQLIQAFMRLMRQALILDEQKFRVRMHLHEYHNELEQKEFWSEMTGIPENLFTKTYWKPHTRKTIKDGYPGCVHIEYYDVKVSRKIYATARAFLEIVVQ